MTIKPTNEKNSKTYVYRIIWTALNTQFINAYLCICTWTWISFGTLFRCVLILFLLLFGAYEKQLLESFKNEVTAILSERQGVNKVKELPM